MNRGRQLLGLMAIAAMSLSACSPSGPLGAKRTGEAVASKSAASERAQRRAFDGAPPVIPHQEMGASCVSCHNKDGMAVENLGFAPPTPHETTSGMSATSRCRQCHVFKTVDDVFVANNFQGLPQDLGGGHKLYDGAPPVIPHQILMRENCTACHAGPAARDEIRTTHPERIRCRQCHVEQKTTTEFPPK